MKSLQPDRPARLLHLGVGRIRFAELEVLGDGAREEEGILEHDAKLPPERVLGHPVDRVAVHENSAALDIVEAASQTDERGLSRASRTDDRDVLARLDVESEVVQDRSLRIVAEGEVVKGNPALNLR